MEFRPNRVGVGTADIRAVKIERVGKRDVILNNGSRYNVNTLRHDNGTWNASTQLLAADDPLVTAARRANAITRSFNAAETAWGNLRTSRNNQYTVANCQKLIAAIQEYQQLVAPDNEEMGW